MPARKQEKDEHEQQPIEEGQACVRHPPGARCWGVGDHDDRAKRY